MILHFLASAALLLASSAASMDGTIATGSVHFPCGRAAFVVAVPEGPVGRLALDNLVAYMNAVLKAPVQVVSSLDMVPVDMPVVFLSGATLDAPIPLVVSNMDPESFRLITGSFQGRGVIIAKGTSERGLKRAVQRLVLTSEQTREALVFGPIDVDMHPWIPAREWTLCPWEPLFVRGMFTNPYADKRLWLQQFSDERLARYVSMMDWFGFSGCQLMETCYSYASFGTVDAVHDWQKRLCKHLRANGQEITLWAWTAEFTGFGWVDPDVTFQSAQGLPPRENPAIRAGFEKYYSRYAELAPYVDRFVAHFFDPGRLTDQQDVFFYMRLLEEKLRAANTNIKMGMDIWAAGPEFLDALADNGFGDYLLLIPSFQELPMTAREKLHQTGARLDAKMGVWGWYTTEMETDQLAGMYVNGQVLKEVYTALRNGPLSIHPAQYCSEMDAHHINNLYSLYIASRLMWEPDSDPNQLLTELCEAIWGPRNGAVMAGILGLIQEVRSGPSWETYWWTRPGYRLGTPSPESDLERAKSAIAFLETYQADQGFVPKLPLPYTPAELADLMLPHLKQIAAFAEFRIAVNAIHASAAAGSSQEELTRMAAKAWKPVPEYDTWIGIFGTKELREQHKIMEALGKELRIPTAPPSWLTAQDMGRGLELLRRVQAGSTVAIEIRPEILVGQFFWTPEHTARCYQGLQDDGSLVQEGDRLTLGSWENWAMQTTLRPARNSSD